MDVGIGEDLNLASRPDKASLFLASGAAVH
jgi:hypothetical protein